jgi:hypothetical protein
MAPERSARHWILPLGLGLLALPFAALGVLSGTDIQDAPSTGNSRMAAPATNRGPSEAAGTSLSAPSTQQAARDTASPDQVITGVLGDLEAMVAAQRGSAVADKVEDAVDKLKKAQSELAKSQPKDAAGATKNAIGDLEAAVQAGLLSQAQGDELILPMLSATRLLASAAIDDAIAAGGEASKIAKAQQSLAQGDALAMTGAYKDAADKSESAISNAAGSY